MGRFEDAVTYFDQYIVDSYSSSNSLLEKVFENLAYYGKLIDEQTLYYGDLPQVCPLEYV